MLSTESVGIPAGQICMALHEQSCHHKCGPKSYYCQTCMESLHSQFSFLCEMFDLMYFSIMTK